ncbi:MAG: type III secretion protein [Deltaproteobacteria bacterium]|jgi:type III secretion protein F|nr:type III secretion protein [Deltaproteobacteria bacterium]
MNGVSGVNVGNFLSKGMDSIDSMGTDLQAKMQEITASGQELKPQDLAMLNYQMGQYQALMTTLNSTVGSIQGHMKEMANSIR